MARFRNKRKAAELADGDQDVETATEGPSTKKQTQRRSLFVRSLPATATTESLIEHFSDKYPIKHATAVTDPKTKTCKGFGFITFADAEDAKRALEEFNGSKLKGRKILLEIAEPRNREIDDTLPTGVVKPKSLASTAGAEAKALRAVAEQERKDALKPPKLIVRNLPWSIKKSEQLSELFTEYGKVMFATLPEKKPGLLRGFGFVVMKRKSAEKAIAELNGAELDGRTLAVDWAVEKDTWQKAQGIPEDRAIAEADEEDDKDQGSISTDDEGGAKLDDIATDEELEEDSEKSPDTRLADSSVMRPNEDPTTLFVRNLPFTSTDELLSAHFSRFGNVRYARVVLDPLTERPRGTAFVAFYKPEDTQSCLKAAPRPGQIQAKGSTQKGPSASQGFSVLQSEETDPSGMFTMDGRVLQVSPAVDRSKAAELTQASVAQREGKDSDRRRLYLLSEGTLSYKNPLYAKLSPVEVSMREASLKQRKQLIQTNPSLHLSLTRLSVRNIPRTINSKDLKALAREAVVGFATDVKGGKRERLSKEELHRSEEDMKSAETGRKLKKAGIVKQAKIVYEGREGGKISEDSGAGRSRGYGFIEYHTHRTALMGLRWLNGHQLGYKAMEKQKGAPSRETLQDKNKRLIVEFAIENAQVVGRRNERESKARETPNLNANNTKLGERKLDIKGAKVDASNTDSKTKSQAPAPDGTKLKKMPVSEEDGKLAKRQRIITKKRAQRKVRKNASKP